MVSQDLEMYDKNSDTPAVARTSNLNEELGQVSVIINWVRLVACVSNQLSALNEHEDYD